MLPLRDNLKVNDLPLLTIILVVVNVAVFFAWQGGSQLDLEKVLLYGNVPYEVSHPGEQCMPSQTTAFAFECDEAEVQQKRWDTEFPPTWMTFFTSMFMHLSIGHLIGNMLFLVVFGFALEAGLGRAAFLLFYVVGGLAADLGHILIDMNSQVPALGASGAISAVMGGYLMLYPRAKIFTWFIPPLPFLWGWMRANWLIGINLGWQVVVAYFAMAAAYGGGGVAYFAHFGGFLAGVGLVKITVDAERIEALRKQARLASGDERRFVEHIETPPGQPAPQQSYPYGVPQPATPGMAPAQAIFGQSPRYAGPTAAASAPAPVAPALHQPDPFAPPPVAPALHQPDPFAPPPPAAAPQQPPPQQPPPGVVAPPPAIAPQPPPDPFAQPPTQQPRPPG